MKESFESWLMDYHCRNNPCILDDELPEAFDEWLSLLDIEEFINLAELWHKSQIRGNYE